jgi:hypothetical protein
MSRDKKGEGEHRERRGAEAQITAYPDLTRRQRALVQAGIDAYARHLEGLAGEAGKLGKTSDAARYKAEADEVREIVAQKLEDDAPQFRAGERAAIHAGLKLLVKQQRAAKGTVRGVARGEWAEELEQDAVGVEADLLPQFADQVELVP